VFGWQEIEAREVFKREKGRRRNKAHVGRPIWKTEEIGKRDQFGVGPTLFLFSKNLRRKTREIVLFIVVPFLPLLS